MANYPVSIIYDDESDMQEGSFNLNAILLSKIEVTTNPTKMTYCTGETMDYSGMIITATYDDESTADVTNRCVFTPATGENFESPVEIVYVEGQDEKICSLTLTTVEMQLVVSGLPTKTEYRYGEYIDFDNLEVKAVYSDGTEHILTDYCNIDVSAWYAYGDPITITVSCAPPLEPYIFDMNSGYIDSGVWKVENPTRTYIDVYRIESWTDHLLALGSTVGSRFRAMFTTTDIFQATTNVTGTAIINTNNPAVNACVECSYFRSDGYIAVSKDNVGVSGIKTYLYSEYAEKTITTTVTFEYNLIELTSLTIATPPTKTAYKRGDAISYAGLTVTAMWADGSTKNLGYYSCAIVPTTGKAFDPETDTDVTVTYTEGNTTVEATMSLTFVELLYLSITTSPDVMEYASGEPIDYTGLVVTAHYSDNSTVDVTSLCTLTPAAGKAFNPETDTDVEISYTKGGVTETVNLSLTEIYIVGLEVTREPTKTAYKDKERISYAGMVITASYSNGNTSVVTDKCSITPARNKKFNPDTDTNVEISYAEASCCLNLIPISIVSIQVTQNPKIMKYLAGESIDYTGIAITATYSNNETMDVTEDCTFSPEEGSAFISETNVVIALDEHVCGLTLTEAASATKLIVDTPPHKTEYNRGEQIDYSGIVVKMSHEDGTLDTVTDWCDFSPAEGSTINTTTAVTVSCAPPIEPYAFDLATGAVSSTGKWIEYSGYYTDVYKVTAEHCYLLTGSFFSSSSKCVAFFEEDVTVATSEITGILLTGTGTKPEAVFYYRPSSNGYIVASKAMNPSGLKTYLYDMSSQPKSVTTTFVLTTEIKMELAVSQQPYKKKYEEGETADYTGLKIKASYLDGTEHDVTEFCKFAPEEGTEVQESTIVKVTCCRVKPYAVDLNNGYLEQPARWIPYDNARCYIDAYTVTANHQYLIALGSNKGDCFRIMFTATPISQSTSSTVTGNIVLWRDGPGSNEFCKYTPSFNGYLLIAKDATGHSGIETFVYDANGEDVTAETGFGLTTDQWFCKYIPGRYTWTEAKEESEKLGGHLATCTSAEKEAYLLSICGGRSGWLGGTDAEHEGRWEWVTGEDWGYTHWSGYYNGSNQWISFPDNSSGVLRLPQHYLSLDWYHKAWDDLENDCYVSGCRDPYAYAPLGYYYEWTIKYLSSIAVTTAPSTTSYSNGDTISYSGIVVTATYSDGSTRDVTDACTITPSAGKTFNVATDTRVRITYAEDELSVLTNLSLSAISDIRLEITSNPAKTDYRTAESIDYSGLVVTATYPNGTTEDVTSSCTITPSAGKAFDPSTDSDVIIVYEDAAANLALVPIVLTSITVTSNPTKTEYATGETADYTGTVITALYSDESTEDVTSSCTFSPAQGETVSDTVTITYTDGTVNESCTLSLRVIPYSLIVETPPTKTTYTPGDDVDYSGAVVKMVYSDGTSHDVTEYCSYTRGFWHDGGYYAQPLM